jgi:hypothetical protein
VSLFADIVGELLIGVLDISTRPGREDERYVRGLPRDAGEAASLLASLPPSISALTKLPRTDVEVWYRGRGKQAKVRAMDVSELGFDDVRGFVTAVLDHDANAVEEVDLDGDIVHVAFAENSGEDVTVGAWGLSNGTWALTVSADSSGTRDIVTKAVIRAIRSC